MNFRLRVAVWFAVSLLILIMALLLGAHWHLDEELRKDRWDRSHPRFPGWVIHGSYTDEEVHDILGELFQVWLWIGLPIVLCSLAAGYVIAAKSVRPIRRMNEELASLGVGKLGRGLGLPDRDPELATLVEQINALLARLDKSYAEMAEFSGRVAHELRTPLTLLRMKIEAAAPELPDGLSEDLQEDIHRLSRLVERSLLAAKAESGRLLSNNEVLDLSCLLESLQEAYSRLAADRGLPLEWRIRRPAWCKADPDLMLQIFHNLLGNAVRYGKTKLRVSLSVSGFKLVVKMTNHYDPRCPEPTGAGLGLRLVRGLCSSMQTVQFRHRCWNHIFSVRVVLVGDMSHATGL